MRPRPIMSVLRAQSREGQTDARNLDDALAIGVKRYHRTLD